MPLLGHMLPCWTNARPLWRAVSSALCSFFSSSNTINASNPFLGSVLKGLLHHNARLSYKMDPLLGRYLCLPLLVMVSSVL